MTKLYIILFFFISLSLSSQICISQSLNEKLVDSLRPKKANDVTVMEACKIVGYTSYINTELTEDYEKIIQHIKKEIPKLSKKEKALVYYTLMTHSHNSEGRSQSIEYSDLFLKLTDKNNRKNYEKLATAYTCKAGALLDKHHFVQAIENSNLALEYAKKSKSNTRLSDNFNLLSAIYLTTYQFERAIYYNKLANHYLKKNSPTYLNYYKFYHPFREAKINFLIFLNTKNLKNLERFETIQDSISKNMMKDLQKIWLSKWHLNNAYLFYAKQNYREAEKEFLKSETTNTYFANWDINEFKTFKILLYLKTKKEKKAISILKEISNPNNFYETLLYSEVYNYYKSIKNYKAANFYIEKLMASKTFENNYKHKGEIIIANSKHNVREKQLKIKQLEQKADIKESQNQLKIAILAILLLSSFLFIIFINRKNRIKRLKQKRGHNKKIRLMKEALLEIDEKLFLERKHIGENIHNDLLGDLVALRYLADDHLAKTSDPAQQKALTDISKEINSIYEGSRNFSHQLTIKESKPENYNIFEYLNNIKERFSETKLLDVTIQIGENEKSKLTTSTSIEIQKVIYSLIKESVSNTIKHSNAKKISISFDLLFSELLEIQIKDNGKTQLKKEYGKGIGLESIKEQVQFINGTISFEAMQDGFQIVSTIPLSA